MHTYMHTYIPTYLPTYVHTYLPTYIHTYIQTYIHTDRHTHTHIHTYTHTNTYHYIKLHYITLLSIYIYIYICIYITLTWPYITLLLHCITLHYIPFDCIAYIHVHKTYAITRVSFCSPIRTDKVSPLCVRCRHPWRYMCSALVEACWQSLNPSWVAFLVSGVVSQWNMVST